MKAQDYISKHQKSYLAQQLTKLDPGTEIKVGRGIITNNPHSNLGRALAENNSADYVVGGRAGQHANDGHHFAVIVNK